jgi:uroporphyrinogen-III decarboxylase
MMTRKERFERALRCEEVDRIPFWVKGFGQECRKAWGEPYESMPELELADRLDLDHMAGGPSPVVCTNDRVTVHTEKKDGRRTTCFETPDGTLTEVYGYDAPSCSWHPLEFPIKTRADLRAARHLYDGNQFRLDEDVLPKCRARLREVGGRGIVMAGMGISPWMNLIQHQIGPEQSYYFLLDYPDETRELIDLMHDERLRYLRCLLGNCPYDYVVSVENTSTTLLSPAVFETYCWQHLMDYGRLIVEAGVNHVMHMCGKLRALLPKIEELPALAIEAYTSPPVGDTTLADRAALCPSKGIIGGTSAALWIRPASEICEAIEREFAEAGTHLGVVLTSAGVLPPSVTIEKVEQVRDFVQSLPVARLAV